MMKNLYKFALAALMALGAQSMTAQSWGFGQNGYFLKDIAVGADGNIWACAYSGDDPDWLDFNSNYILKLSPDGEKIWGITPPAGFFGVSGTAMAALPQDDGGVIIFYNNFLGLPGFYKLDTDGNLLWESSGLWTGDYFMYGGAAVQLNDGRIVAGGLQDFHHQIYVCDNTGDLLTSFSIDPDTTGGFGWSYWEYKETGMVATADGGFAYATGNENYKILYKYDSDLNLEWSQYYDLIEDWEYGYQNSLKTTSDGGLLLAGSSSTGPLYYATLRKIDADGNLEWAHSYNHGYDWEEGAWALELSPGSYIMWDQNSGDNSSDGWLLDADGNETGSVPIPIVNCNWGFGEYGMEIWDVEKTSDGSYLIGGRQFVEDCSQRTTIIKSNPDGSFAPCLFNCVWPGDANNDGYADMDDLFEIGINYGATGFSRDDMGIDWTGKLSRAWMEEDSLMWYIFTDLKWTDCNGDGIINDADTSAVALNLGLDHPLNTLKTSSGEVPLYFAPVDSILHVGLNQIPIMLGDELNPVDEIYGLSFTIQITGTENIDGTSLRVNFNDSWLSTTDTRISISKTNPDEFIVDAGVVRKDRANTGGFGEIGTLSIVVIDNITGKIVTEDATIEFIEAKAIQINREEISLETASLTFPVEESSDINSTTADAIQVFPNPAHDVLNIGNPGSWDIQEFEISDMTGKIWLSAGGVQFNAIDISSLSTGNYLIRITCAEGVILKKFNKSE